MDKKNNNNKTHRKLQQQNIKNIVITNESIRKEDKGRKKTNRRNKE